MKTTKVCIASGDTHDANVVDESPADAQVLGGASVDSSDDCSVDIGVVETTTDTTSVTPSSSANLVFLAANVYAIKLTNAGTLTVRIKEGVATLASVTTGSFGIGNGGGAILKHVVTDATAALHTYSVTVQWSTTGGRWILGQLFVFAGIGSLTGAAGTCT